MTNLAVWPYFFGDKKVTLKVLFIHPASGVLYAFLGLGETFECDYGDTHHCTKIIDVSPNIFIANVSHSIS